MPIDIRILLKAAEGEIVGKVRLQKVVYLLDQLGMNSGYSYEYHHYGPYSEELTDEMDSSIIFGEVEENVRRRLSDGVPYSVFSLSESDDVDVENELGDLPIEKARDALTVMRDHSATVLELAATIHWLSSVEQVDDWRGELVRRKGVKTEEGRTDEALQLLTNLELQPES
jgi:uncharacterized protein YwgA